MITRFISIVLRVGAFSFCANHTRTECVVVDCAYGGRTRLPLSLGSSHPPKTLCYPSEAGIRLWRPSPAITSPNVCAELRSNP